MKGQIMIIDHNHPSYQQKWKYSKAKSDAYYRSKEIVEDIIPKIKTKRSWLTIKVDEECTDKCIVFIHNNAHPEQYEYLANFKDLVLVCSNKDTMKAVKHLGKPIYLPLDAKNPAKTLQEELDKIDGELNGKTKSPVRKREPQKKAPGKA